MDAPWLITEHHQIQRAAADLEPSAPGVVYYVQFVDLVKIGFSTNLRQRMLVIPHDKILATEPGSITLERSRHRQFADLMVAGQREWFRAAPELLDHAASLRAEHGDPDQVASAIQSGWSDAEIMRQYGGPERLAAEIDALSH